ncbi:hypothetical protein PR048_001166 [Dryococelus australis]|uniref:Uncharacterized protein n=1 Tax=Dryococelus australis TaxID=614101 RepID=A0ABQ9IGM0_9NEOP|nr:hypothetical protein PR048_001166 [Dryococelus australis]
MPSSNQTGNHRNPYRLWSVEQIGMSILSKMGKRFVYKRIYGELGAGVEPDGWDDDQVKGTLLNSETRLLFKGWINSELFLEWFQFFIDSVPAARPLKWLGAVESIYLGFLYTLFICNNHWNSESKSRNFLRVTGTRFLIHRRTNIFTCMGNKNAFIKAGALNYVVSKKSVLPSMLTETGRMVPESSPQELTTSYEV